MIIALCALLSALGAAAAIYWMQHLIHADVDPADQGELRLTAIRCIGCRGVFCVPDSLLSNVRACPLCRGELLRFSPEPGEDILDEFVEVADPADDQEGDA